MAVLSAAGEALYKRVQQVAETEQRSVDDLRAAAHEGRQAAERRSAEVEEDYRQAAGE